MMKIPNLQTKNESFSSISSTQMQILQQNQHFHQTPTLKYKQNQFLPSIIMDISLYPQKQQSTSFKMNNMHKQSQQRKAQKYLQNYQRFKIQEKFFDPQSDASEQEQSPKAKGKQNIFFTQILQSKVFDHSILLKNAVANTNSTITETHNTSLPNHSQREQTIEVEKPQKTNQTSTFLCSDVHMLMNGCWCSQKIIIKKQEIRFSNFYMIYDGLTKIKMYKEADSSLLRIKLTINSQDYVIGINQSNQQQTNHQFLIFANIINAKITNQGIKPMNLAQIDKQKKIMKKSQHFCRWEQRLIKIQNNQLRSYKGNNVYSTFVVKRGSIKQLWTRFDLTNNMLIIKITHSLKKTQFGIPITDFSVRESNNWLYLFYKLLRNY